VTSWRFDWRRDWNSVWSSDFISKWEALIDASPAANIYHRPAVVRAWAETHGRAIGAEPLFGYATNHDGARVLLTFIRRTQRGRLVKRRSLSAAGEAFFGYHDPLVSAPDGVDWSRFWKNVRDQTSSDCDQALLRFVHAGFANGSLSEPATDASPLLDLSNDRSLDDVYARCSSKHRHETRRLLRRLGERGATSLRAAGAGDGPGAVRIWSDGFLPAYNEYWRAKPAGSMLDQQGVGGFAARVVEEGTRDSWAECGQLEVGADSAAWYVGLLFRDSFYLWISAYNRSYLDFSPGRLMLALLIERCIDRRLKFLHLMTGDQQYKREWQPVDQAMCSIRWHAPTAKGRVLAWYDRS
jgi:CelD/BcsL family acetyltransferase involved in cellulose biosynthesis